MMIQPPAFGELGLVGGGCGDAGCSGDCGVGGGAGFDAGGAGGGGD